MLCMAKLAVIPRMILPHFRRIIINLFQRITFILTIDIFYTRFQCLLIKKWSCIINLSGMFYRRGIINIPFGIFIRQIVINNIRKFGITFTVVRRLTETIRNGQQLIFFRSRMLIIHIQICRTESSFRNTVTMKFINRR